MGEKEDKLPETNVGVTFVAASQKKKDLTDRRKADNVGRRGRAEGTTIRGLKHARGR